MDALISALSQHFSVENVLILALFWVFSAAVQSMPEPLPHSSRGYVWAFNFFHTLAANIRLVNKVSTRRQIQDMRDQEQEAPSAATKPAHPAPPLFPKE